MKRVVLLFLIFFLPVSIGAKAFDITLSKQELALGETLFLKVVSDSPLVDYKCVFLNKSYDLFFDYKANGRYTYVAYLGASRYKKTGEYVLILSLKTDAGSSFYEHYSIQLDHPPKKPGKVNLSSKSKKIATDTSARKKELRLISSKFSMNTQERYFKGPFELPMKGRLSSVFGKTLL